MEHLRASSFFQDLEDDYLSRMVKLFQEETYQAQDVIIKEGEEAKKLYVLVEGTVAIQIRLKPHQDVVVSTIEKRGELFGWSAVVEPKIYSAAVKSLEKTRVLSVRGEELEKLFRDDPVMGLTFMNKISSLINQRLLSMIKRLISSIS
jgi:CRP-like cAMP-binding protein